MAQVKINMNFVNFKSQLLNSTLQYFCTQVSLMKLDCVNLHKFQDIGPRLKIYYGHHIGFQEIYLASV
jgi:cadmium resistance protein CadD (predicted permease)